jgi:hypothetical protein
MSRHDYIIDDRASVRADLWSLRCAGIQQRRPELGSPVQGMTIASCCLGLVRKPGSMTAQRAGSAPSSTRPAGGSIRLASELSAA